MEARKSRTGFLQALLGKHPLHFMLNKDLERPQGGAQSKVDLSHLLFVCNTMQTEREAWITHLETDLNLKIKMNSTLFNILKQSTKPVAERTCCTETIMLVAFGGHCAHLRNGKFVVTRKDFKRLSVSDIVSRRTADFLQAVHSKYSKMRADECHQD